MSYLSKISLRDSSNLDAFGRLRVSTPALVHDAQFTYNLLPFRFESLTNGSGAAVTHDATNRAALMTFASTPSGGYAYMQTYEYFRYQPGRSQLATLSFNFRETIDGVTKFAGYSDGVNGIEFQASGSGANRVLSFARLSGTSLGNQTVAQANWNLDKLDGTGPSGITIDVTKAQILIIDLQALYVGRVRCGFDIKGEVVYAHEFDHANVVLYPYVQYASLPLRCGMSTLTTASTTMLFICSAVSQEGGTVDAPGFPNSYNVAMTAASGADTHVISIRPKLTYEGFTNRVPMSLYSIEALVTGTNPVQYSIVVGQAITGTTTFNDVGTRSAFEYNSAGTLSGSPSLVIETGYIPASNSTKGSVSNKTLQRAPILLGAKGDQRLNGTISLIAKGIGGSSACNFAINWIERR